MDQEFFFWKLKVTENEYFPADVLIINTSESKGSCYIETKNLDGETNLKYKQAHKLVAKEYQDEIDVIFCNFFHQLRT